MTTDNLLTAEGARAWVEDIKTYARQLFEETGDVLPQAMFVTTRDSITGKKHESPQQILAVVSNEVINDHVGNSKDKLAVWLRSTARRSDAVAYAFLSEAWLLVRSPTALPKGSWENEPDRMEVLRLVIEHDALGHFLYVCDITRDSENKPTLGPWKEQLGKRGGRFNSILPSAEETAQMTQLFEQLLGSSAEMTPKQRLARINAAIDNVAKATGIDLGPDDYLRRAMIERLRERGHDVEELPASSPPVKRWTPTPEMSVAEVMENVGIVNLNEIKS